MIIDAQGPFIWTLEDPGTFLTYIWGLSGSSARYSCPAINISSGRRVLILELDDDACTQSLQAKAKDRIVEVTFANVLVKTIACVQ